MATREQIYTAARAIYHVSCEEADDGERQIVTFDRLAPTTKDLYLKMARAAAEAIKKQKP